MWWAENSHIKRSLRSAKSLPAIFGRRTYFSWSSTICRAVMGRLSGNTLRMVFFTLFGFDMLECDPVRCSTDEWRQSFFAYASVVSLFSMRNALFVWYYWRSFVNERMYVEICVSTKQRVYLINTTVKSAQTNEWGETTKSASRLICLLGGEIWSESFIVRLDSFTVRPIKLSATTTAIVCRLGTYSVASDRIDQIENHMWVIHFDFTTKSSHIYVRFSISLILWPYFGTQRTLHTHTQHTNICRRDQFH